MHGTGHAGAALCLAALLGAAGTLPAAAVLAEGTESVTWGHEEGCAHLSLLVPFTTPDRERVEVVVAYRYTDPHLEASDAMMRVWRASLPDTVDVLRLPLVWMQAGGEPRAREQRRQHRQMLLAARLLGVEERVHAGLVAALPRRAPELGGESGVRRFLDEHGIAVSAYEAALRSPAWEALWWEGAILSAGLQSALSEPEDIKGLPWLLINGRHVTSAGRAGGAAAALRVANRLIREAMASGPPYHHGPANIPELVEMLAQWRGTT